MIDPSTRGTSRGLTELSAEPDSRPLISVVIPCFNEEQVLPLLYERLMALAKELQDICRIEFILVDDGSRDATWTQLRDLAIGDGRFHAIRLSRNFGHQAALTCGYRAARGDSVVCLDADLQDPPEMIPEMIRQWQDGADVVFAVRSRREGETWFKLATAKLFYRFVNAIGVLPLEKDVGDFRLVSRRALQALLSMNEQHRYLRGMVCWIGFRTARVTYERDPRAAGETKYPFLKLLALASDGMVSFSRFPLRLSFHLAWLLSLLLLVYLGVVLIHEELAVGPVGGVWASLLVSIIAFGSANLLCLAVLGEYVGRIYEESKARPLYFVQDEICRRVPDRATSSRLVRNVHSLPNGEGV